MHRGRDGVQGGIPEDLLLNLAIKVFLVRFLFGGARGSFLGRGSGLPLRSSLSSLGYILCFWVSTLSSLEVCAEQRTGDSFCETLGKPVLGATFGACCVDEANIVRRLSWEADLDVRQYVLMLC